eukprot:gene23576-1463_t
MELDASKIVATVNGLVKPKGTTDGALAQIPPTPPTNPNPRAAALQEPTRGKKGKNKGKRGIVIEEEAEVEATLPPVAMARMFRELLPMHINDDF